MRKLLPEVNSKAVIIERKARYEKKTERTLSQESRNAFIKNPRKIPIKNSLSHNYYLPEIHVLNSRSFIDNARH